MKFRTFQKAANRRAQGAFTLAEVLAALVFMAIVIPVAIEGLRVASSAGVLAQRKAVAMRIGERVLNELVATDKLQTTTQKGTVQDGALEYNWTVQSRTWTADVQNPMTLVTVQVQFPVQGRDQEVHISTLVGTLTQ